MNFNDILIESVPFEKSGEVISGLKTKYGSGELDAYTFGIELEYIPDGGTSGEIVNMIELRDELYRNRDLVRYHYRSWLDDRRNNLNRRVRSADSWDDSYGPIDPDTFDKLEHEPDRRSYTSDDPYEEDKSNWNDRRKEVEDAYNRFEKRDIDDFLDEYIDQLIESGEWQEYVHDPIDYLGTGMNDDIDEAVSYIQNQMRENVEHGYGGKDTWGVGEDGDLVEIRSKHLTQNDFFLVKQICDFVKEKDTSGGTSAHVHVGLPNDFDAFDLLAITTLVDEKAIKLEVGPDRKLNTFAQLRNTLHRSILRTIGFNTNIDIESGQTSVDSFYIKNETLMSILSNLGRFYGTNISAMKVHGTIEFRYLSSEISNNPNVFISWIKYYLLLPKVAKSRNSVILRSSFEEKTVELTAIREPGRVRFVVNKGKKSKLNVPASMIKSKNVPTVSPTSPKLASRIPPKYD